MVEEEEGPMRVGADVEFAESVREAWRGVGGGEAGVELDELDVDDGGRGGNEVSCCGWVGVEDDRGAVRGRPKADASCQQGRERDGGERWGGGSRRTGSQNCIRLQRKGPARCGSGRGDQDQMFEACEGGVDVVLEEERRMMGCRIIPNPFSSPRGRQVQGHDFFWFFVLVQNAKLASYDTRVRGKDGTKRESGGESKGRGSERERDDDDTRGREVV